MPYNIQNKFFNETLKDIQSENRNKNVYGELVKMRFVEVIESTFPLYSKYISKNLLEKYIEKFIIYGSKTNYVWQISYEFIDYLIKIEKIKKIEKDILFFEKEQIKIYVLNIPLKSKNINYKRKYKLSKNVSIMKHNVNIIEQNYEVETNYVMIYKNIEDYDVYFISISKFVFMFLKYLRNNNTIDNSIKIASKLTNISYRNAKDISKDTIANFVKNAIIV